jgi:undecaprenyl diphosphate synthase
MDGNRRWARERGLPTLKGHQAGVDALRDISHAAFESGVETLTFFAFSTENWKRTEEEVGYLMGLFARLIVTEMKELDRHKVRFRLLGAREGLDKSLLSKLIEAEERTKDYPNGTFALCINYGGELELAHAAANLIRQNVPVEEVTPARLAAELYAPELPMVDMIIRTSGEHRLSGFMLWRASYAELYFVEKNWPDFSRDDLKLAFEDYSRRVRRFGV